MKFTKQLSKHLVMLVGNIGSGKSTTIKEIKNRYPSYVTVCQDSLRYMIGGGTYIFNPNYEPIIKFIAKQITLKFMNQDYNVIIDEVNVAPDFRKPYLEMAKFYGYKTTAIVLPRYSKDISVANRLKNNHGQTLEVQWYKIWKKFNDLYVEPSKEEGFDEIIKRTSQVSYEVNNNGKGDINVTFTN